VDQVDQAFLQLTFAIKLLPYFETSRISKIDFDHKHVIQFPSETVTLDANAFHTPEDLILAAHNNFTLAFAFSAIALHTALKEGAIQDSNLRTLIGLIRNAFAHNPISPGANEN
jgi:hypothetical protein